MISVVKVEIDGLYSLSLLHATSCSNQQLPASGDDDLQQVATI